MVTDLKIDDFQPNENPQKKKSKFLKILAKAGIFVLSILLKKQKNINPNDVDKATEILNQTL